MKGRVVVLKEHLKPFEIEEYEVPDPEPGAILIRITQAGICGSDLHWWRGDRAQVAIPKDGIVLGHEGTGIVAKLGNGVTTDSQGIPIKEGDRVMHYAVFSCFRCHHCLRGDPNICPNRKYFREAGKPPYFTGTYSDYLYINPGHPFFRVPDELSDDLLGPINCAWGTVSQGLMSAGIKPGQYVVLMGAGGLGLCATTIARRMGAERIIILDRLDNRLRLAEELGADYTINIDEYNTPEARIRRVWELTGDRGADIVMELVGHVDLLTEGIPMISNGGTFIEIGQIYPGQTVSLDPSTLLRGKRILGSAMYHPSLLPNLMEFIVSNQNKLPFHKMISHKFKLEDVNQAFSTSEWQRSNTDVIRGMLVP